MSDTSSNNMLGKLTNIKQQINKYKEMINGKVEEKQINLVKEIQIKIENLISELPKEIYNFKKDDYMTCRDELQEIIDNIIDIKEELRKNNLGLEGIKIINGIEQIEKELVNCRNKAINKVNK